MLYFQDKVGAQKELNLRPVWFVVVNTSLLRKKGKKR